MKMQAKRLKYVYNPEVNKGPEGSDYSQKLVSIFI